MTLSMIGSQNESNDDADMGDVKRITEVDIEQVRASKEINPQPNHQRTTLTIVTTITTLADDTTSKSSNGSSYSTKLKFPNPFSTIYRYCKLLNKLRLIITHRWWWWELSSIFVSILTMMTVFVILFRVNNKALSEWGFPIQPNSMVSVFMAIFKSTLLVPVAECISQAKWMEFYKKPQKLAKLQEYDEASRGPWGAAALLLSRKFAGWIACLGALLAVLSLALDPFVQQILDFPSRHVPFPAGVAEVASTQSVDTIDISAMRGEILSSIYVYKGPESRITYKCTTSSCLWSETITSLGVCSVCYDITTSFTPVCTTTPGPLKPNLEKNETWTFDTTTCVYTFDPNKNITLTVYIQTLSLPSANGRPAEYASQYTHIEVASQVSYTGLRSPTRLTLDRSNLILERLLNRNLRWLSTALTFTIFYDKDQPRMPKLTITDLAPDLHVCGLYFCAQSYDQSLAVINGTMINTSPTISLPLGNVLNDQGLAKLQDIPDGQLAEVLEIRPDSTLINLDNILTSTSSNTTTTTTPPKIKTLPGQNPPTKFTISQQALFSMESHLRHQILNISQSSGNVDFGTTTSLSSSGIGFPEPNYGLDALASSAYANMTDTFARIAQAITLRMRVEKGSIVVKGEALVDETYFSVRWGWLGLPLGVLGLAVVLLVGTILRSSGRERGEGIWKGNSLAMLVHPLVAGGELMGVRNLEDLERCADGIKVMLDRVGDDGAGLGFVSKL